MNVGAKFLDPPADWSYLAAVPEALRAGQYSPDAFRQVLDAGSDLLRERFAAEEAVEDLVRDRARLVDVALLAGTIGLLAARLGADHTVDAGGVQPLYLRRPDAEVARDLLQSRAQAGVGREGER